MSVEQQNPELSFGDLVNQVWKNKGLVIVVCIFTTLAGLYVAISKPDVYMSEVLLSPNSDDKSSSLGGLTSELSGISTLVGLSLGGSKVDQTLLNLEVLKSRHFLTNFIEENDLAVKIMAVTSWDMHKKTLSYDEKLYNQDSGQWVREVSPPRQPKPSAQELYEAFTEDNLVITSNTETGLLTVAIKHYSPYIAQQILTGLVDGINKELRERALKEADLSIQYLESAMKNTDVSQSIRILYELIETQQNEKMLASVKDDYAFKIIDPAIVPEKKYGPSRALIIVLAMMLGLFLSVTIITIKFSRSL
ncbi:Wzz/FepE/Etk N-terminal domain-containing protein [Pseudoalteromonas sp. SG44-8]|uniref:Wzz/FepE/Etk N-terminal domain-containing protein n=1 Tax=Pseudoalteromonas sp. SG44-8 TaxID=2760958 RepID=UPI0016047B13|nr:Wzz/FepE/Etk N-terminal domain-containing protein [Pseudoalteromonas sp. SG44-8]MBB1399464.1 LPS O-antigen length regulator [Pseudoalteromonas sp. SG44-8]